MPNGNLPPKVFISYSHDDRDLVARLADDLMKRKVLVWWDEWEIGVGESLIEKVEGGISSSSYLAVVLSPASVASAWVRQELNAALIRQLRERRVFVLPLLVDDCEIPPFLQDKRYADFREDYHSGLVDLLKSIDPPDTRTHGEGEAFKYHHDYAIDWGFTRDRYGMRLFVSSHSQEFPHSVLCTIMMVANPHLTQRVRSHIEAGFAWAADVEYATFMLSELSNLEGLLLIEGDTEVVDRGEILDPDSGLGSGFEVRARRLGPDPGNDLVYEWRSVFDFAMGRHIQGIRDAITDEQAENYQRWVESNPLHE